MAPSDAVLDHYGELYEKSEPEGVTFEQFLQQNLAEREPRAPIRVSGKLVYPNWPELRKLKP